eukprot:1004843-Prorocentrum_minimum.AAC.1
MATPDWLRLHRLRAAHLAEAVHSEEVTESGRPSGGVGPVHLAHQHRAWNACPPRLAFRIQKGYRGVTEVLRNRLAQQLRAARQDPRIQVAGRRRPWLLRSACLPGGAISCIKASRRQSENNR